MEPLPVENPAGPQAEELERKKRKKNKNTKTLPVENSAGSQRKKPKRKKNKNPKRKNNKPFEKLLDASNNLCVLLYSFVQDETAMNDENVEKCTAFIKSVNHELSQTFGKEQWPSDRKFSLCVKLVKSITDPHTTRGSAYQDVQKRMKNQQQKMYENLLQLKKTMNTRLDSKELKQFLDRAKNLNRLFQKLSNALSEETEADKISQEIAVEAMMISDLLRGKKTYRPWKQNGMLHNLGVLISRVADPGEPKDGKYYFNGQQVEDSINALIIFVEKDEGELEPMLKGLHRVMDEYIKDAYQESEYGTQNAAFTCKNCRLAIRAPSCAKNEKRHR